MAHQRHAETLAALRKGGVVNPAKPFVKGPAVDFMGKSALFAAAVEQQRQHLPAAGLLKIMQKAGGPHDTAGHFGTASLNAGLVGEDTDDRTAEKFADGVAVAVIGQAQEFFHSVGIQQIRGRRRVRPSVVLVLVKAADMAARVAAEVLNAFKAPGAGLAWPERAVIDKLAFAETQRVNRLGRLFAGRI